MQQSNRILEIQTSNDQVMDMVSFTTPGEAKKENKQSRRKVVQLGENLLLPYPMNNNKTRKRKGNGRRRTCRNIGCNGRRMASPPTRVVTPHKRAKQPITFDLVIDSTLLQAIKRRK